MRRTQQRLAVAGLVVIIALAGGAAMSVASFAATASYDAVASAAAISVTAAAPQRAPLGAKGEGRFASAQTKVTGFSSMGEAASPDPGATVRNAGALLPLPPGTSGYPLYVTSSFPGDPKSAASQPGVSLVSTSDATTSKATATTGGTAAGAPAAAARGLATSVVKDDDSASATAETEVEGFTAAGVFTVGSLESKAVAQRDPSGKLSRSATVAITGLRVAGQAVEIRDGKLVAAGNGFPLPGLPIIGVLAERGVAVQYVAASETPDGVTAPGLLVTVTNKSSPEQVTGLTGPVTVNYLLGFATAFVVRSAGAPDPAAAPDLGSGFSAAPPPPPAVGAAAPSPSLLAPVLPGSNLPGGAAPSLPEAPSTSGETGAAAPTVSRLAARSLAERDITAVYLALFTAAALAALAAQLVRYLGVKAAWRSS